MRKPYRLLLALLATASVLGGERDAAAQADVAPPLPNVMLLVDTSGSMEYKSSEVSFPACSPSTSGGNEKSRWIELVEVLTGSIQDYRCETIKRNSTAFKNEYSLSGQIPPDFGYFLPYHRPLSGTCTAGPGTLPSNAYAFPADAIKFHHYADTNNACTSFTQTDNGLLDAFGTRVRFGLMTFDTHPEKDAGVVGSTPNYKAGVDGTWSYFLGQARGGKPAGCDKKFQHEVGARNAAAPPWEGRMVSFGPPAADSTVLSQRNEQIQKILLTTRPYDATPIAGMLHDARDFLWNDTSADPLDSSQDFGPYKDPFITGGCRDNFVVLLSDGEPNRDLRPFCEGGGPPAGECPYDKSEEIALDLSTAPGNKATKVFVIGFAVSDVTIGGVTPVDCEDLSDNDLTSPSGVCAQNPDEKQLQACCTLNRIAYNGDTNRAYFADDIDELRTALSAVLSSIATNTTSRTVPVFASGASAGGEIANSYRFLSSFQPRQFDLWSGVLERQRFVCEKDANSGTLEPKAKPIDKSKGDDFAANVNSGQGKARTFISVQGSFDGGSIHSTRSVRPALTADVDGAGVYTGVTYQGAASTFVSNTQPAALNIDGSTCPGMTAAQCRDKYLKWLVGLNNGTTNHRCPSPGGNCNLLGDIYHSTPRAVGNPSALLRDETYVRFAALKATRPLVLYTSTNDGMLHAFKVASNDPDDTYKIDSLKNNELWAFLPPAVLPGVPSQYPGTHQELLDGAAVVRDVVAREVNGRWIFDRGLADARDGQSSFRTVLLQSFGPNRGGYFALDVTDPEPAADGSGGPKFLWQLTTDAAGNPLFGSGGSTPLITTLYFDVGGGNEREVAVAILPGGTGSAPSGAACNRDNPTPSGIPSTYTPRAQVNCWSGAGVAARSLTIARLDTGEIIRTFRRDPAELPAALQGRVVTAHLDSPITGAPVAFPGETGAVADRLFIGDADGTLWRVDLSATDPDKWDMTMFMDPYFKNAFDDGQPIETAPVLSVDIFGNVTVAFSTGDQDVLSATPDMLTYVASLTEKLDGKNFVPEVNWWLPLPNGERVTGPMTIFSGVLYFSSFKPEPPGSLNVCKSGESRVWGIDYIVPEKPGDLSKGGAARFVEDPSSSNPPTQFIDSTSTLLEAGATVFGVSVAQLPTCVEEASVTDSFFGSGTHTSIGSVNPGKFQLIMHTGNVGDTVEGGQTRTTTIDLPPPPSSPIIDSWAALID